YKRRAGAMVKRQPADHPWQLRNRSTRKGRRGQWRRLLCSCIFRTLRSYWKDSARGVITGLTRFANKGHIARAALEATAFQTREVVEAMERDSGSKLAILRVDGGMVENDLLMQFQADMLNRPVVKPVNKETTALGTAYAAGLAVGFFKSTAELSGRW